MSCRVRSTAAALGVLAYLVMASAALADGGHGARDLTCQVTGTTVVYSGTYDNVVVPSGQSCYLSNATILGDITVEYQASLDLQNSGTVRGNLLVNQYGGAYEDSGWVIHGTTTGNGAGSLSITGTVHNILAEGTYSLDLSSATVDGNIVSDRGVFGGAIASSVIHGNILINRTTGYAGIDTSWLIAGPQLSGAQQEIDGSLVLTNNHVPIYVFDNHIKQNLVCEGNTPPPFNSVGGVGNRVDGRSIGQCATVNPAPPTAATAGALSAARAAG
jgi:hypothetical protein